MTEDSGIRDSRRGVWALGATAAVLAVMPAGIALAIDFQSFAGDGAESCGEGTVIATLADVEANQADACAVLGTWDIMRIGGGGSIDGPGYGCGVRATDPRGLGSTLCTALETGAVDPEPEALKGITAAHNAWRAMVGVAPLVWSDELATRAQAWADELRTDHSCALRHSGPGENLSGAIPEIYFPTDAIDRYHEDDRFRGWGWEKEHFDAANNTCATGKVCGHYTQIVWADSQRLGCGVAICPAGEGELFGSGVVVCQYDPPGNFGGERPFPAAEGPFQVELQAQRDTTLRAGQVNVNEGANPALGVSPRRRAVVGFSPAAGFAGDQLVSATLRLSIAESTGWPAEGGVVDAHRLPPVTQFKEWREGNGQSWGVAEPVVGTGQGATWRCSRDEDIAVADNPCFFERWAGASSGDSAYQPSTAPGQAHIDGATGAIEWDVTQDVTAGSSQWAVKLADEAADGEVAYHAREQGSTPPTLVLELSGNQ